MGEDLRIALLNHLKEDFRKVHDIWPHIDRASGRIFVSSDKTNSTVTPENVTGLSFPVEANKTYGFRFCIKGNTSAQTCALRLRFTGPASPTRFWARVFMKIVGTEYQIPEELTAFDVSTSFASFASAGDAGVPIEGFLVNGTNAGTVQLQFHSEVGGETVTIYASSWGEWHRLN
jgi:hypothetical protein